MLSELKPKLNPVINAIAKPFAKINPNVLSVVGLVFPVLFFYFMYTKQFGWALIMMVGSAFDMLDGAVARLSNKTTKFGGLLDSTFDRFSDALMILGFYYAGLVTLEIALVVLVLSYLISYIRSRAELAAKGEFVLNVGFMERPERILFLGLTLIAALIKPVAEFQLWGLSSMMIIFCILATLSLVTVFQRMIIAAKRLR